MLFWGVVVGIQVAGSWGGGGRKGVAPFDVRFGCAYVEGGKRPGSLRDEATTTQTKPKSAETAGDFLGINQACLHLHIGICRMEDVEVYILYYALFLLSSYPTPFS